MTRLRGRGADTSTAVSQKQLTVDGFPPITPSTCTVGVALSVYSEGERLTVDGLAIAHCEPCTVNSYREPKPLTVDGFSAHYALYVYLRDRALSLQCG